MRKILVKKTMISGLVFLFLLLFTALSIFYWSDKLKKITQQISLVQRENFDNQQKISHYNQLLNERQTIGEDIKKIKNLFFSQDDILDFKNKIASIAILYNLLSEVKYEILENENKIRFSVFLKTDNLKNNMNDIVKFLKALESRYLIKIENISFSGGNFIIEATGYILK